VLVVGLLILSVVADAEGCRGCRAGPSDPLSGGPPGVRVPPLNEAALLARTAAAGIHAPPSHFFLKYSSPRPLTAFHRR
jgi:hypothetical protein